MNLLYKWAKRHNVSKEALDDLANELGLNSPVINVPEGIDERNVQAEVRLEAGKAGVKLWRNNVGVLKDTRGVPVRYGLANDSHNLNALVKSADLIGWRRVLITQDMVGSYIAQIYSRECKHPNWSWTGSDREEAQLRWAMMILLDGGNACFCNSTGTI